MKNMSLEKIAQACGGVYHGSEEMKQSIVESITTDSRQAAKGCLFVAIPGERVDGHDFISSVFEKGALAVLSEKELANPAGPYIQVASSLEAVKGIAEYYRQQLDIKVVGITGSVGKTSTKEVIASVLAQKYNVLKTLGNFNNELGLPLTVFLILTGRSQKVDILIHKSLGIKTIATIVPFPQRVVHTQINLVFIGKGFGIGQVDTAVIIVSLSGGILILPSSEKTVRSLIFSRLEEGMFGGQKIIGGIVGG